MNNIHPTFDNLISRQEKELYLNQEGIVLWLTGLSGSGKSTIAQSLERELFGQGYFVQSLDGDNIRTGLGNNLGFSLEDRNENIRRIAEVAKLFKESGIITICTFVSPTKAIREMAKRIIGEEDFVEVFIDTPLHICEARDVKGLYKKARNGEIKGFTGIDSPFESPESPDIHILTEGKMIEVSTAEVMTYILPMIKPNTNKE